MSVCAFPNGIPRDRDRKGTIARYCFVALACWITPSGAIHREDDVAHALPRKRVQNGCPVGRIGIYWDRSFTMNTP